MKKVIIIGGGIAGLSAGVYAQQLGFESVIYERHSLVGGLCTGWQRQGYHIDGCIHWLTGTKKDSELYEMWENLDALPKDIEIIQHDNFGKYYFDEGDIVLWQDLDRLKKELLILSPEDEKMIVSMINDVKAMQYMEMPATLPMDLMGVFKKVNTIRKMMPSLKPMNELSKITCIDYGKKFKHPSIQKLFAACMPPNYTVSNFLFSYAAFCAGNAAVPKGGSLAMAYRIKDKYEKLGGKIVTNASITDVLIEDNKVKGVEINSNKQDYADYVISTCDPNILFKDLLHNKFDDKELSLRYKDSNTYALNTSVIVSLGVDGILGAEFSGQNFETEEFKALNNTYNNIAIKSYAYETSFAPDNKTVIQCSLAIDCKDYSNWESLNKEEYKKLKEDIGNLLQVKVEKVIPEIKGKTTVIDTATPLTFNRYTGAYKGAWMAFVNRVNAKALDHTGKIEGLDNIYFAGQWTRPPGGLPIAASSGKFVMQRIAKKEGMPYQCK